MSTTAVGPRKERFESLDALRGVAILGIFMVNIEAFAMTWQEFQNPVADPNVTEVDLEHWRIMWAFFQFKFITIFSALFGAGIVLFAGEEAMSPKRPWLRRRLFWLLFFGLIHNYVIWFGDILVPYAVAGLIGAAARRLKVLTLVLMGFGFVLLAWLVMFAPLYLVPLMPAEQLEAMRESMAPGLDAIVASREALSGPYLGRLIENAGTGLQFELMQVTAFLPRILGVMFLGMALYKSGFLTGRWPAWSYLALAPLAAVGAYLGWTSATALIDTRFDMLQMATPFTIQYWASLAQALGYAAIVILITKVPVGRLAMTPFTSAGRMAFSNYIGCSIAATFIFWGPPGLGKIGELSRAEQGMVVLAFWAVMLVWSTIWMRLFSIGPLEWVWRTLTYKQALPMRRQTPVPGG